MCRRARSGVAPYSAPLRPGTWVSALSSSDLIAPSEIDETDEVGAQSCSTSHHHRFSCCGKRNLSRVVVLLRVLMVVPLWARCSWKQRTSSAVAVSSECFRKAANLRQAPMWLCVS
jgi:hypothetical protein